MRAFIAIEMPENVNALLQNLQKRFTGQGKINFTKPPYHLTLKFLGEITQDQAEKTITLLKEAVFKPFELELERLGVFPNESYIQVLWVGVKGEQVNDLQQKIDSKLSGIFGKDSRFHAHITLGRVKFLENKARFKELLKLEVPSRRFEVKEFKLIKSELTPQGPEYEDVEVFKV